MAMSDVYPDPAKHPGIDPFLRSVAESPNDGLPKHLMADWLDEQGYPNAAAGMRWAAKYGKHPDVNDERPIVSGWFGSDPDRHWGTLLADIPHAVLPEAISYSHPESRRATRTSPIFQPHRLASHEERPLYQWKSFLTAVHHTRFDENNDPISEFTDPAQAERDVMHPGRTNGNE